MMLQKWNYQTRQYDPYEVPDDWNVKTYSVDMDEIINCAHCGAQITFGSSYTSHEIHTEHGMGYCVCHVCYFEYENSRYYKDLGGRL